MMNYGYPGINGSYGCVGFDRRLFSYDIRRDVRNCALFLFLFYAFNLLASGIYEAVIIFDNFAGELFSGRGFSGAELVATVLDGNSLGLLSMIGIVCGAMAFLIYRKRRFFTDIALPMEEPLKPSVFIMLVVATQGIQYFYGHFVTFYDKIMPGADVISESYEIAADMLSAPIGIIYTVAVGPIIEELIFRGAILGSLRKYGNNFAILFSALLFAVFHGMLAQIPFAFFIGLLLGYVAIHWSLRTSIALHMISNGIAVCLNFQLFSFAGGVGLFLCGLATVIFIAVFRNKLVARILAGSAYYGGQTYVNGFKSIAFWIFVAVMLSLGISQIFGFASL